MAYGSGIYVLIKMKSCWFYKEKFNLKSSQEKLFSRYVKVSVAFASYSGQQNTLKAFNGELHAEMDTFCALSQHYKLNESSEELKNGTKF